MKETCITNLLKKHGWNGKKFRDDVDWVSLHRDLSTVYMGKLWLHCNGRSVVEAKPARQPSNHFTFKSPLKQAKPTNSEDDPNCVIQSYCPDILLTMFDNYTPAARKIQFDGICLLADISGFTKLSSAYCLLGSQGLDDLYLATNGFLGHIAHLVYKHGGDGI